MTGYGRGEHVGPVRAFTVEVQSLNARFLETRARLPRRLAALEQRIQREVQRRFSRGRFELSVTEKDLGARPRTLRLDLKLAADYAAALRELQERLGLPGQVTLEILAAQRDVLAVEEAEEDAEGVWEELRPAVDQALADLDVMRAKEGEALVAEVRRDLGAVEATLEAIQARAPALATAARERLQARVADLLGGRPPDPPRLEQEVAFLAERADITEECARLRSHLAQFQALLRAEGPQGRRLDFLLQEMNREANTIGSKAGDAAIAHEVVEVKAALERIREQVQNLE